MSSAKKPVDSQVKANENAYLYAPKPHSLPGLAVVSALQKLGEAAHRAENRAVIELHMNPADILATRYLLQAERDEQHLSPTDLSKLLGVTTAAASKLVDRLVESGRAERVPHPTDKRAQIIVPTAIADATIHSTYALIHAPLVSIVNELSPEEATVIARFATTLATALAAPPTT
jgi:DNA-binding MarR family transcriptional regulator